MKIAACFYGKFCGKNANGDTQSFEIPYQHFKVTVKAKYNVDLFLHGWDDDSKESEKLLSKMKPKDYILEKQIVFDHPYKHYNFVPDGPYSTQISMRNNYSRFYSLQKSLSLVDASLYDLILISRFDAVYYEPFRFELFDPNNFYVSHWNLNHEGWGFNDVWFLSGASIMKEYGNIHDRYSEYLDIQKGEYIKFLKSRKLDEKSIGSGHPVWRYRLKELGLEDRIYCYGLEYETYGLMRRYNQRNNPWGRPNGDIMIPQKIESRQK
jgi:hypothetical protein